jgi:demethylmenaquinone methyltransferase/2-methoxy-6-polyprenyl-1,4-benzoquinol methylase
MSFDIKKENAYMLFNRIANEYDLINSILSFGLHHSWRKSPLKWVKGHQIVNYLDLASGTGDQLIALLDKEIRVEKAFAVDPADQMLLLAKEKFLKKPYNNLIETVVGDAHALPFEDHFFDLITLTFGLRNLKDLKKGIKELFRVCQKNGQVHIIEFGMPKGVFKYVYQFYLKYYLPKVGKWLSKDKDAYAYLNRTIESFASKEAIVSLLYQAGFKTVKVKTLTFGIVNHFIAIP